MRHHSVRGSALCPSLVVVLHSLVKECKFFAWSDAARNICGHRIVALAGYFPIAALTLARITSGVSPWYSRRCAPMCSAHVRTMFPGSGMVRAGGLSHPLTLQRCNATAVHSTVFGVGPVTRLAFITALPFTVPSLPHSRIALALGRVREACELAPMPHGYRACSPYSVANLHIVTGL